MKSRNLGQEILEGLAEIKEWQHGKKNLKATKLSRPHANEIVTIRHQLALNQKDFALFLGVSIATLQNWEQGRREPQGAARSLLLIAKTAPAVFLKTLHLKKNIA